MNATYRVDFESANNEDLRQAIALTDTAAMPVDLTGASLRMDITAVDDAATIEASSANGRLVVADAPAGRFEVAVPAASMRSLPPGSYRHDLVVDFADGRVQRVWTGTLTLAAGVTP